MCRGGGEKKNDLCESGSEEGGGRKKAVLGPFFFLGGTGRTEEVSSFSCSRKREKGCALLGKGEQGRL